jgi:hypothetical protein
MLSQGGTFSCRRFPMPEVAIMNPEQSLEEYLSMIAVRDLDQRDIKPKDDVQRWLETELQRRTGCEPAQLDYQTTELQPRRFVSAKPEAFVVETVAAIEAVAASLKKMSAKCFEVRFTNVDSSTTWGDQVQLRVRVSS